MVHSIQLNEIQNWLKNFKEKTFNPNTEIVLFDIVCGDFNIDNMSPVDKISYENEIHPNLPIYTNEGKKTSRRKIRTVH